MAEHSGMRIGNDERDVAVRALQAHFEAGRLDADAFEEVAVSLSPFVAVALFFLTGSWLWFLLIPVLGVVYGVVYDSADG